MAGTNMTLADSTSAYALEITDTEVHVFEPEDGLLVRTNHYLAPELQRLAPTVAENPGTFQRYQRAWEMADRRRGEISVHDLVRIMSDHSPPPTESICRHGGGRPGVGQTYAAMVICPQDRGMWAMFGNPCEAIQMVGAPDD